MAVIETMQQPEASPPSILSPCPQQSRGRPRRAWFPALWAIVLLLVAAGPSVASDLGAFDAAVSDAYGHYREAAFYLRTGNVDAGAIELEFAIARWNDVQDRFRNDPPDAYADVRRAAKEVRNFWYSKADGHSPCKMRYAAFS